MKILLSWLKEYLPIEDVSKLPDIMTRAGIEVDHIEEIKPAFTGVVAARIKKVVKHPSSPKLVCVTLFDGKSDETVVSSVQTLREGMLTAYATVGAQVATKRIEATKFGDVASHGVLVSEHELGLSSYQDGVMDLPASMKEGMPLNTYFADTLYEVSITPNLGHCQSIMGIARELAAFMGVELNKKPWIDSVALHTHHSSPKLRVTVQDVKLCPRYSALLLEGVEVGPSPSLIRIRLERTDHRSINNVVDITNYISHDIGQPLHAFDADRIQGSHLIVRASKPGESLTLLDEVTHKLPEGTIVIADDVELLAAGGIMGGELSAVSPTTTRVVFESASFSPGAIRKARTKLTLCTDSSKRFERGSDMGITLKALESAYQLLKESSPHLKLDIALDVTKGREEKIVSCRLSRAGLLLGYEVSADEAESAFQRLGLACTFDGNDTYTVKVPSFRHDINEEVDLIEEIGRLVGLQRETTTTAHWAASRLPHHPLYLFEGEVRRRLLTFGLQEAMTSDLISPAMAAIVTDHNITDDALVKMLNPLSSEQSVLRPSLLPSLLDVVKRNINQRTRDLHFFEVGHVHLKKGEGYAEPRVFAILLSGLRQPQHFSEGAKEVDFFDVKGILEELFSLLRLPRVSLQPSHMTMLHPGRQAKVYVGDVHVGIIGEIHPALLQKMDIHERVCFAECDIQELLNVSRGVPKMRHMAIYPSSERDWTITLPKRIRFSDIMQKIDEIKPSICESCSLVSLFSNEKLGLDKHNVTLHFVYRDKDKTVSQEEVETAHKKLVSQVSQYLGEMYPQ